MNLLDIVNTAVVIVGVPTVLGACIYVGRKLQTLDTLEASNEKIKHNLNVVSVYLTRNHEQFNGNELKAFSPLELTETGKAFVGTLGFDNVFDKHKKEFFAFIDGENPKLKYDVETAAIKSVYALYHADFMNFLKVYFYNNPSRNLENTAPTLGVYLRDQYLALHPEITQ